MINLLIKYYDMITMIIKFIIIINREAVNKQNRNSIAVLLNENGVTAIIINIIIALQNNYFLFYYNMIMIMLLRSKL